MPKELVCDICQSRMFRIILNNELPSVCSGGEIVQNTIPLKREECQECGFIKTVSSPLDEYGDHYYKSTYSAKLKNQNYDFVNFAFNKNFVDVLNDFILEYPFEEDGTLLDIGCGKGGFEKAFLAQYPNWKATGVDPSLKSIEIARKNAPDATFVLDKYDFEMFKADQYDLIAMHTILNRVSPAILIKDASILLKENGILSVQIAIFEQTPFQFFFADHPYIYDFSHLAFICANYGLHLIRQDNRGNLTRALFQKNSNKVTIPLGREQILQKNKSIALEWQRVISMLTEYKKQHKKIAIYGAGTTAAMLIAQSEYPLPWVIHVFDDNEFKIGEEFLGREIVPLSQNLAQEADAVLLCAGPDGIERMSNKVGKAYVIGYGLASSKGLQW